LDQLVLLEGEQSVAVRGDELLLDLVAETLFLEPVLHLAGRRLLVDEHLRSSQDVQVALLPPLGQHVLQLLLHHVRATRFTDARKVSQIQKCFQFLESGLNGSKFI